MKEQNEPSRQFAEIWKEHNDPDKKEEFLMLKRREQIKEERLDDYCLNKNEE